MYTIHDDVITWTHFLHNGPFEWEIHLLYVDSQHIGLVMYSVDGFFVVSLDKLMNLWTSTGVASKMRYLDTNARSPQLIGTGEIQMKV